jgi:predicted DNA-binding transcriptional regulator AlpA
MDELAIVDWKAIKALGIPYSRTEIWRKMAAGKFPRSFKLGDGPKARVVWWRKDIRAWLLKRAENNPPAAHNFDANDSVPS